MGYLYQRKGRDGSTGGPWWIKYYVNGRPVRESPRTDDHAKAKRVTPAGGHNGGHKGRHPVGMPVVSA